MNIDEKIAKQKKIVATFVKITHGNNPRKIFTKNKFKIPKIKKEGANTK